MACGLVVVGWLSLTLIGPFAGFLTWWGDCSGQDCATPTDVDRIVYLANFAAWVVLAFIGLRLALRPNRWWFIAVGAIGIALASEAAAAFLGFRGFLGFGVLLPAALLLVAAGLSGARALAPEPPMWAMGTTTSAISLGCLVHVLGLLGFFAVVGWGLGPVAGGLLIVGIVVASGALIAAVRMRPDPTTD